MVHVSQPPYSRLIAHEVHAEKACLLQKSCVGDSVSFDGCDTMLLNEEVQLVVACLFANRAVLHNCWKFGVIIPFSCNLFLLQHMLPVFGCLL